MAPRRADVETPAPRPERPPPASLVAEVATPPDARCVHGRRPGTPCPWCARAAELGAQLPPGTPEASTGGASAEAEQVVHPPFIPPEKQTHTPGCQVLRQVALSGFPPLCTCGAALVDASGYQGRKGLEQVRAALPAPEEGKKDKRLPHEKVGFWRCWTCGWQAFGNDVSHACPGAMQPRAKAHKLTLAEELHLSPEERLSTRYFLGICRDSPNGNYSLLERYLTPEGETKERVLESNEGFEYVVGRLTDTAVERMSP